MEEAAKAFKKISGRHYYKENGELKCIKKGGTIKCKPSFLGKGALDTFKPLKNKGKTEQGFKKNKK